MKIKILQNSEWHFGKYLSDNYVLETTEYDGEFESVKGIRYSLLNLETNERIEVLPNINKYNIGEIIDVSTEPKYLYFANVEKDDTEASKDIYADYTEVDRYKEVGKILLLRYNISSGATEALYNFSENLYGLNEIKKLKIFFINDYYIIIQNEYLVLNKSKTYSGFFRFNQRLYNIKDETEYMIADENFNLNGIMNILAISDNQCVIKTGYSLLEDNRYNLLDEDECSLEAVSFVNIGQMVSDLAIGKKSISLETIEQTYHNKTIPYIKKMGDYVIYSCVNNETKEEEVKFYNLTSSEIKTCINQDVIRISNLAKAYVLNNEPYICIIKDNELSFLNLNTNKIEPKYNNGSRLCEIYNNLLVFTGVNKTIFGKKKTFFDIISFPGGELLLHEQSEYVDSLITNTDTLYIIVK